MYRPLPNDCNVHGPLGVWHNTMFSLCLAISIAGLIMTFTGVKGTETSNESLATSPAPTDGLYCMSCFNCKIFEKTSHSVKCDPSSTHCLVFVVRVENIVTISEIVTNFLVLFREQILSLGK
eukprot:TCALIF_06520-PA protein Name:"Protein of unknown function" AED:0.44 eAED:0.50 QI:0/0/0/0.5/0/0.5/2/0/121